MFMNNEFSEFEEISWASYPSSELRSFDEGDLIYSDRFIQRRGYRVHELIDQHIARQRIAVKPIHPTNVEYQVDTWEDSELDRMGYMASFFEELETPEPSQNLVLPVQHAIANVVKRQVKELFRPKLLNVVYPKEMRKRHKDALFGRMVPTAVQRGAEELMTALDRPEVDVGEDEKYTVSEKPRFIAVLVAEAKLEFPGAIKNKPGTRECVHHFVSSRMKKRGMRPTHMADMLPIVVELVMTPSKSETQARQFINSMAVINREYEYNTQHYSRESPWLFNWFGTRRKGRDPNTN